MFGRKPTDTLSEKINQLKGPGNPRVYSSEPPRFSAERASSTPPRATAEAAASQPRRTATATPSAPPAATAEPAAKALPNKNRILTIPSGVGISGKIMSCDTLVVDGAVEASLTEGRAIRIGETGHFHGTIEIIEADIAGQFNGSLTVHGRLTIRARGRVTGQIRYADIAIEAGGQIGGDVGTLEKREQPTSAAQSADQLGVLLDEIADEGGKAAAYAELDPSPFMPRRTGLR